MCLDGYGGGIECMKSISVHCLGGYVGVYVGPWCLKAMVNRTAPTMTCTLNTTEIFTHSNHHQKNKTEIFKFKDFESLHQLISPFRPLTTKNGHDPSFHFSVTTTVTVEMMANTEKMEFASLLAPWITSQRKQ